MQLLKNKNLIEFPLEINIINFVENDNLPIDLINQ